MPTLHPVTPLSTVQMEQIGFSWHTDSGDTPYVAPEVIELAKGEAQAYYDAAAELYRMYETAAEHVITQERFAELDIPEPLIDLIRSSWEHERHAHLYGRFDLAGGIDGRAIKLIEFNADTPTMLVETAVVQWMLLHQNGMMHEQFNTLFEHISRTFASIAAHGGNPYRVLFSAVASINEEHQTVRLLKKMALQAGILTRFEPMETVRFDAEGIYDRDERLYDAWFKLFPWEEMVFEDARLLTQLRSGRTLVINPAYTLLYQSKGMLKILWELFPASPYLLETSHEPLSCKCVRKPAFGREGANVAIIDPSCGVTAELDGPYARYRHIYQAYEPFVQDQQGRCYQAGVFYSGEPCGLGFRRGKEILDNTSQFVGHFVR